MNFPAVPNVQRVRGIAFDGSVVSAFLQNPTVKIALFLMAHAVLALAMVQLPLVSTLHAIATLAIGLWLAVATRQPERVVYVITYIAGAEVLWRMTQAQVFWEFGKYAVVAILSVTILRTGQFRGFALPFLYFALLLPSLVMPMAGASTEELRGQISFNLSGHLALMVSVWYCSQIRLSATSFYRSFLYLAAPVVGVGAVALMGTFNAAALRFGNESNFATSGGFGPNQVSAILGLGVLALFLFLVVEKKNRSLKIVFFVLMVGLAAQSAMTFSRTGLYTAGMAAAAAMFYLVRDARARMKFFGTLAVLFLVANYLLLPKLESFTNGTLLRRFQSTSLTGRDALILADLQVWSEHPIFGVGPGMAIPLRAAFHRESAAHTEFTRLVAEHGLFGLIAVLLLIGMALRHLRRTQTAQARAINVALTCWSFGFMAATAMRLVAPAVLFGLGSIILFLDDTDVRICRTISPHCAPLR